MRVGSVSHVGTLIVQFALLIRAGRAVAANRF